MSVLLAVAAVAAHLAASGGGDGGPLSIGLTVAKAQTTGGEPVTLRVSQRTSAPVTMSSIDLNWADTQIHLTSLADRRERVLTGADRVALGGAPGRPTYPSPRAVASGEAWTISLPLYAYTRPLPPGRYSVRLTHRYEGGVACSNVTEFSIHP